ncbi:MAG: hypothetical protein M1832_000042 [Thelocarpon impressellum]|nr:MAG: hypothetical protein M1832_000042 [Thelocarpon impressellum]
MDEELERALADLGNHRRENLPLEGSRMRVNLEVLEQSKRVHQPGTQEYALAKKEKSKVSAAQKWKAAFTASGVADTPAEIAAGINTGNSHRTRMVAAMRDAQEQRAGGNHRVGHQVPGRTKFAFNDARMTHGGIPPRMLAGPSAAQKRPVQSNAPTAAVATQGKSSISNRGGPAPHGRQPQRQYHQPPALHLSSSLSFEDDGTVTGIIFKGVCGGKGSPMEPAGPPEARANDTRTERKRSMSKADAPDPLINRPRRPSFDVSRLAKPEEFLATVSSLLRLRLLHVSLQRLYPPMVMLPPVASRPAELSHVQHPPRRFLQPGCLRALLLLQKSLKKLFRLG